MSMISAIENGSRHPTVVVLDALARSLNVDIKELYVYVHGYDKIVRGDI